MSADNLLAVPVLSLGGTDGAALGEQYGRALGAVEDAIDALREVTVHGRDYQGGGPSNLLRALRQHHARLGRLEEVHDELTTIYEIVLAQLSAREGSR